jgi:hypothetical protein
MNNRIIYNEFGEAVLKVKHNGLTLILSGNSIKNKKRL